MSARRLDGAALAAQIRQELMPRAAAFAAQHGRPPGLGIVLAGQDAASEIYVGRKLKAVADAGCRARLFRVAEDAPLSQALTLVEQLNADPAVDGVLVQSPLPRGMGLGAEQAVFDAVDPAKDVDGFHPHNVGLLAQNRAALVSCTPLGCVELLERCDLPIAGRHVVVIGRSNIVGKPLALLLLHRDATVTICHSRTSDLPRVAAGADILVVAVGRAGFVTREFVKPGATVIDVGVSRVTDASEAARLYDAGSVRAAQFAEKGSLIVGDVHPDVEEVAGAITPVPGGIGPMTVAMVLRNTILAAEQRVNRA